ncbi:MAG TPA: ChaN family lipoprotein [Syntrophobacteraceae bacterium]|nr:ChaN family lipoprotein [Syntrophobacteraceae bacterium]
MHLRIRLHQNANHALRSLAALCPMCAALSLIAACSTTGKLIHPPSEQRNPVKLQVGAVIETATGDVISMDELIGKISKASVVYVGETHTSTEDHKIQLEVLQKLSEAGRCVELGMEMFPATAQPILDRYINGQISEESFLKEVGWKEGWGFPYALYRGLIDWQKQKHMPVLGLNAPNKIVSEIARGGLESLSPEERSQVARQFHLDDPANRERIRKAYSEHEKGKIKDFKSFFEAQLAWEETMAQTIVERLKQAAPGCVIVVAIGKGHINDRLGVPYLARLRKPHEYTSLAPVPIDYPLSTVDPNLADYVVITDKEASQGAAPGVTDKRR